MLIELYILFELLAIVAFFFAFYNKNEILWMMSLVLSGMLMLSSYAIHKTVYVWNATIVAYQSSTAISSYPAAMGINLMFFGLSLLFFMHDILDKYGIQMWGR